MSLTCDACELPIPSESEAAIYVPRPLRSESIAVCSLECGRVQLARLRAACATLDAILGERRRKREPDACTCLTAPGALCPVCHAYAR